MVLVEFESMMRNLVTKNIEIEFAAGDKRKGILQALGDVGLMLGVGEGTQFIPYNQVKSITEIIPKPDIGGSP